MSFPSRTISSNTDDPRLGDLIGLETQDAPRVVLLGFPSDEGVRRNGGRVGASEAPALIRKALYKLTPDVHNFAASCRLLNATRDLGDLEVTGDLEEDQQRLGETTSAWLSQGVIPIIIGGGHETAFGHFLGYAALNSRVDILNLDAHADVRPLKAGLAHSGSPFFQALEHASGCCAQYSVLGLAPWTVAHAHIDYLKNKGCVFNWASEVNEQALDEVLAAQAGPVMVTLDMDVVNQAEAPGVSAPAISGIPLNLFLHAAFAAGKSPAVTSLDLSEVNPRFDVDNRTARAAALAIWFFLKGVAERDDD